VFRGFPAVPGVWRCACSGFRSRGGPCRGPGVFVRASRLGFVVRSPWGLEGSRPGPGSSPVRGSAGFCAGFRGVFRGLEARAQTGSSCSLSGGSKGSSGGSRSRKFWGVKGGFMRKESTERGVSDIFDHLRRVFVARGPASGTRSSYAGGFTKTRGLCGEVVASRPGVCAKGRGVGGRVEGPGVG